MADNNKTLICPACGKVMKKVFISSANFNVDICLDGCGGIYFDNGEYKKLKNPDKNIAEIVAALEGKTFNKVDTNKTRVCPMCGHNMVKNHDGSKGEIEIDECYSCGGLFLDINELHEIRAQFETEEDGKKRFEELLKQQIYDNFGYSSQIFIDKI